MIGETTTTGPGPAPAPARDEAARREHPSTMLRRFGWLARILVRLAFRHVRVRAEAVARVRQLAAQGTLIYVMRYRSRLDYLLVNAVLLREGLPLARFAPGLSTLWWRPMGERLRWLLWSPAGRTEPPQATCAGLVAAGEPVLLFMRSRLAGARIGPRYLREVLRATQASGRPVFLLPVAIFRGTGFRRRESRFATLLYSVQEAPGEAKRLFTYLWNAEQIQLTLGREISLGRFLEEHHRGNEERTVRRLTRALQIFLYREERVVLGPALLPRRIVRHRVLRDPELGQLIFRLTLQRGVRLRRVRREARRYFDEMAANFNGLYFGVLEFVFNRVWPRVFSGLEMQGLERVVECIKQHPVVLVPCHRSHFDYLILTYIFHTHHLSPPHIAAGINLSFWPMGPLFRGAGAFFIRRTFEDNELYKMVFRKYLAFLIREGYTQEFFIEGGRTRTGKILTPKLGMLSAIVNAFVQGVRRDLYLVPISIHYGRIPEEEAYRREVSGEAKERETFGALLRARSILKRRYGTAYVSYAKPISLADTLGTLRERFGGEGHSAVEEEKRRFVQRLGFRLLREVNGVAVAGATSVSATALLAAPRPACRLSEFQRTVTALIGLLRLQGVHLTKSLQRNEKLGFRESLDWLATGGLLQRLTDADETILYVPVEKRIILDFYKNNIIHFFLVPALVTRALLVQVPVGWLRDHVSWWLDLYRWEFPLPERDALAAEVERCLAYFRAQRVLVGEQVDASHPLVVATAEVLENFREAYLVAARTLRAQGAWPVDEPRMLRAMQERYRTSLLLGEARKPEGNSVITFGNALSRLAELGYVRREPGTRGRSLQRGPAFAQLAELIESMRTGLPFRGLPERARLS
jgi:glycerol-3-phosphate O-acyltransferase